LIVQAAIVEFLDVIKELYSAKLLPRAQALVGWLHNTMLLQHGFLVDSDFPDWVSEGHKQQIISRFQLFAAHKKKTKRTDDDGKVIYYPI